MKAGRLQGALQGRPRSLPHGSWEGLPGYGVQGALRKVEGRELVAEPQPWL